ncbi:DUF1905 domain-containing protein [uncultured Allobaculum sp.]|uniref:DUF1905 domain-containing protein n=1 Tax=uncultured Allobaculum sp. TaxID=1187017 RepID=UPI002582FBDB|nr:DUF1905 domain-containing protein [uncultured Allobaculum sp.]
MEIEFDAVILQNGTMDAAYIEVPYDIRERTGKDRWLVDARFDDVPYSGQVVRMKTPFYLIGLNKQVRKALGKSFGDRVHVVLKDRQMSKKTDRSSEPIQTDPSSVKEEKPVSKQTRPASSRDKKTPVRSKPETVDEYIQRQPESWQADLKTMQRILREAMPNTIEKISWSMPTFWKKRNLIHFAGFKNHIGLYPGPEAIEQFKNELNGSKTSKGTIQIRYGKIDEALVSAIAKWTLQNQEDVDAALKPESVKPR